MELNSVTSQLVSAALDASTLRQQTIATNIANANTPGYRPQVVSFEDYLTGGVDVGNYGDRELETLIAHSAPQVVPGGPKVMLDMEMVRLTQNTVHYQALLKAQSKLGQFLKLAIGGGK